MQKNSNEEYEETNKRNMKRHKKKIKDI